MKKRNKKKFSVVLTAIVIIAVTIVWLLFPKGTEAAWFDDSYGYRQKVTIGNSGSADSNKKVKFDVDTATLITNGKLQSDCDDIRFTDQNGKLLPHYLDASGGACNTASTDFYVLIPTIYGSSTDTMVYMYYGNPSSTNISGNQFTQSTFSPTSGPAYASEEKGQTPVLYWKFDEGYGTTSQDSSSSDLDASSITTWKSEDFCVIGKCISLDGTEKAGRGATDSVLNPGTASFTVSVWFRHNLTNPSERSTLISRYGAEAGYMVYMNTSGQMCFGIDADATWTPTDEACTSTSYADSKWHFVTAVKNGTSNITVYIDGLQIAQDASITGLTLNDSGALFSVGVDEVTRANYWTGFVDEVKVYTYAKTATQIKADYVNKGAADQISTVLGSNTESSALSQGLLGYWKLEENTGTSTADSSGNGFTGTLTNSPTWTTSGKFGNAVSFDGAQASNSDVIDIGDQSALELTNFTISGWVYRSGACSFGVCPIFSKGMSSNIGYSMEIYQTGGVYKASMNIRDNIQQVFGTSTIGTNTWYHVAASVSGSRIKVYVNGVLEADVAQTAIPNFGTEHAKIGNRNGGNDITHNGVIDEVRVYNRVLSDQEIRSLYETAPAAVGWWKLDEGSGTVANDSSGNANIGTLTSGPKWSTGKYGSAVNFDGNDDEISAGSNSVVDGITSLTASAWIYPKSMGGGSTGRIVEKTTGWIFAVSGTNQLEFFAGFPSTTLDTATVNNAVTLNQWNYVTVIWDGTATASNVQFFVNGVKIAHSFDTNGSGTPHTDDSSELIHIGNNNVASRGFDGKIDEVRLYNYLRTQKQIVSDMNAGHPVVGTPMSSAIGHWSFDEGYGTTANDKSLNGNSLTLSAAGWTNSGKLGKAYEGATNRRLTRNDDADFDFASSDDFSISIWIKGLSGAQEYLVSKINGTTGYALYEMDDGFVYFCIGDSGSVSFPEECVDEGMPLTDVNRWYHLVAVKEGTSAIRLYVDGRLAGSDTSLAVTGDLSNSGKLILGDANETDDTDEWLGDIDEVKMYRFALNADQVKTEYNQGKTQVFGALSTASDGVTADNSSAREYCVPGDTATCNAPAGEWNFDEHTGATAYDTSGNGNNLTLLSSDASLPSWARGKKGSSLLFDGSTDYTNNTSISSSLLSTGDLTISAWIFPRSTNTDDTIIRVTGTGANPGGNNNYDFQINTGGFPKMTWDFGAGPTNVNATSTVAISAANTWTHITAVRDVTANTVTYYENGKYLDSVSYATDPDGGTSSPRVTIGANTTPGARAFDGMIDMVRVYTYVRTPAQVAWDYNRGGPVGWWKFDECSGTTAYDASGNSYNGTITPGGSGNTSANNCTSGVNTDMRYNGATGKFNAALDFDGTNDYVDIGDKDILNAISITAWIYWDAATTNDGIMSKRTASEASGDWAFRMSDNGDGALEWMVWSGVDTSTNVYSSTTIPTGSWHHVALTFDNSNNTTKIYIDGKLDKTDTTTVTNDIANTAELLKIGTAGQSSDYFDGRMDDVRIYNYVLTDSQMKSVANENAAIRFGPNTGSP